MTFDCPQNETGAEPAFFLLVATRSLGRPARRSSQRALSPSRMKSAQRLAQHHRRRGGVAGVDVRHRRQVADPQPLDAAHAQAGIEHRHGHRRPAPSGRCRPDDSWSSRSAGNARAAPRRSRSSGSGMAITSACARRAGRSEALAGRSAGRRSSSAMSSGSLRRCGETSGMSSGSAERSRTVAARLRLDHDRRDGDAVGVLDRP